MDGSQGVRAVGSSPVVVYCRMYGFPFILFLAILFYGLLLQGPSFQCVSNAQFRSYHVGLVITGIAILVMEYEKIFTRLLTRTGDDIYLRDGLMDNFLFRSTTVFISILTI